MSTKRKDTPLTAIVNLVNAERFEELIQAFEGNRYCKSLTVQKMAVGMWVGMIQNLTSLRDIETFTDDHAQELKEVGLGRIARSSLAEGLQRTNPEIFRRLFSALVAEYEKKLPKPVREDLRLFLMDSTLITVPIRRIDWAHYNRSKGGIKLHTIVCRRPASEVEYPVQMVLTDGKTADLTVAERAILPPPDSIFVADRGYEAKRLFRFLSNLHRPFVVRVKAKTYYYPEADTPTKLRGEAISDEYVTLHPRDLLNAAMPRFRRIVLPPFKGRKHPIVLLTNDFSRTASEIGEIYRQRWHIELFFKWIKQHLHLSTLIGCSRNAVENQLYLALILALIIAYLQSLSKQGPHLTTYKLFQHLRNRLFHAVSLFEALFGNDSPSRPPPLHPPASQLTFQFL